jgi:ATP-dependent Clp protease ATP-binding subunit ClpA
MTTQRRRARAHPRGSVGFGDRDKGADTSRAMTAIEKLFSPEFRNRLDAIVLFSGLDREVIRKVVDKEVRLLGEQLAERKVTIEITNDTREWLADNGYDAQFGARPMGRTVENNLKKPLADLILFGGLKNGGHVVFEVAEQDGKKVVVPRVVSGTVADA